MITRQTIQILGLFGHRFIAAYRLGDWAAHENVDIPGQWVLTLLPLGLNLPTRWATFSTSGRAILAMREITRVRNDWSVITQADMTKELGRRLKHICIRCGSISNAPNSLAHRVDTNRFGKPASKRQNGYRMPMTAMPGVH